MDCGGGENAVVMFMQQLSTSRNYLHVAGISISLIYLHPPAITIP